MNKLIKMVVEKFENYKWYERIKFLRQFYSYSIKKMAEKCITTEKAWWSWENGKVIPSKRNKQVIASVLDVEEELIFG